MTTRSAINLTADSSHNVARGAGKTAYDPAIHHRRSIRLRGHDYAGGGVYFVTLCVADRRPLFGTVVGGRMALNDAGRIAAACWREIPDHFPQVVLDEWIVMPDHVHGILMIGNAERGTAGRAPAVIGGFLSPMERAVFEACLADGTSMVWILARGLPGHFPTRVQRAIDGGRLLVMTPFEAAVEGFSAARAAWCNQYALHLASSVVIGQLAPDGMLACLLADLRRDIPVYYLAQDARKETSA